MQLIAIDDRATGAFHSASDVDLLDTTEVRGRFGYPFGECRLQWLLDKVHVHGPIMDPKNFDQIGHRDDKSIAYTGSGITISTCINLSKDDRHEIPLEHITDHGRNEPSACRKL
jgi:hypothetical protein